MLPVYDVVAGHEVHSEDPPRAEGSGHQPRQSEISIPRDQCTTGRHGWIGDLRSYCWDSGMLYIKIAGNLPAICLKEL